jgi:hypothetical protein
MACTRSSTGNAQKNPLMSRSSLEASSSMHFLVVDRSWLAGVVLATARLRTETCKKSQYVRQHCVVMNEETLKRKRAMFF